MSYATSYMRKSWQIRGIIGREPAGRGSFPPEPLHPEGPLTKEETEEEEAEVKTRREAISNILAEIFVKEFAKT